MFTFQEKQNPLAMLLGNTGSGIVQGALEKRQQEKESNEVMRGLSSLGEEESPLGVYKAIAMLNLPSEKKEQLFKQYTQAAELKNKQQDAQRKSSEESRKAEQTKKEVSAAAKAYGIPEQEVEGLTSAAQVKDLASFRQPKNQARQDKKEKELTEAQSTLFDAQQSLQTLDDLDSLSEKLRGPGGFVKAALGTESAAEYNSLATAAGQPIVKLYNPTGPIATRKMELLLHKLTPSAGEFHTTQKGKTNALRNIAKQGVARAQERVNLLKKSGGDESSNELKQFDQESEQLMDTIAAYELGKIETAPEQQRKPGDRRTNRKTGEKQVMDGNGKWKPIK